MKLATPFELSLNDAGALTNGLDFASTFRSRLAFQPHGQVVATLPFSVTINSFTQDLVILLHDDNIFDSQDILVKVDFDACAVSDLLQQLLGKLGSFELSPENIFGASELANLPLNLPNVIGDAIDDYFPNVGQFIDGVLEGKFIINMFMFYSRPHVLHTDKSNVLPQTTPEMYSAKSELFHLCKEIEFTGAPPPTLEHVISMILEDILGEAEGISAASTSQATQRRRMMHLPGTSHLDIHHNNRPSALSSGRRRALRAHHLPHNHLKRARRLGYKHRHLSSDLLGDLLDAISVEGGFDGAGVFFKLDLDISKQAVSSLENLLTAPLDALSEVDLLQKLFPSGTGSGDATNVNSDISLSASAHLSVKGKSTMIKRHHVSFMLDSLNSFSLYFLIYIVQLDMKSMEVKLKTSFLETLTLLSMRLLRKHSLSLKIFLPNSLVLPSWMLD